MRDVAAGRHLHGRLRRAGNRGQVRRSQRPDDLSAAAAPDGADLPGAVSAVSGRDRIIRSVAVRPGRLQLVGLGPCRAVWRTHGPRQLLPQPLSLCLERAGADALAPPQPADADVSGRSLPALAPVGLDRRPAHRPLHRELTGDAGPDPRLLRTGVASRLSTRGDRAVRSPPGRRSLRDGVGADAPQAARRGDRRVQPAAPAVDRRRRRTRMAPSPPRGGPHDQVRRAAAGSGRGRHHGVGSRPGGDLGGGVRDCRGRGAGSRPSGDRSARRRRARDESSTGHRPAVVGRAVGAGPGGARVRRRRGRSRGLPTQRRAIRRGGIPARRA